MTGPLDVLFAKVLEETRLGWWWERFALSRCFRHDWREVVYREDTGYSYVEIDRARECSRCGAWRRVDG